MVVNGDVLVLADSMDCNLFVLWCMASLSPCARGIRRFYVVRCSCRNWDRS